MQGVVKHGLVLVWLELVAVTLVELVLEFHPVQSQSVEEALKSVHQHQHAEGDGPEHWPTNHTQDEGANGRILGECTRENQVLEDLGQLGVGKRQCPKSQVRGSVGDSSKHELNGLNHLVDEHFAEGVAVIMISQVVNDLLDVLDVLFAVSHDLSFGITVVDAHNKT